MPEQTLTIPAIGPTLNQWYAGTHWSKRSRAKKRWRLLVRAHSPGLKPVEHYPVAITVRCRFGHGSRSYDASNCAATAKLIEDGLVKLGILENDSRKYVRSVLLVSEKHQGSDHTVVTITEPETTSEP